MYRIPLSKTKFTPGQQVIATSGTFDGLHQGHMELLGLLNQQAQLAGAWRLLITFDLLPHEYFADRAEKLRQPRISLLRDKIRLIAASDLVDEVVILHFNQALATLSADKFTRKVLQQQLGVTAMIVGHDFRFGNLAQGTSADLERNGITITEFPELKHNHVRISSSLIRKLAAEQNLAVIRNYLGHNICFSARIVRGNQLARTYGIPTINLNLAQIRPVLWGIYVSYVYIEGIRYQGVTNIGKNPTVSAGKVYKIETHLFDVALNLYGKIARVEILHFLRPELKFADLESLFKQIYQDMAAARNFFHHQLPAGPEYESAPARTGSSAFLLAPGHTVAECGPGVLNI